jgi:hypothetical protein
LKDSITIHLESNSLKTLDQKCAELKISRKYFVRKCTLLFLSSFSKDRRWFDERRDDQSFSSLEECGEKIPDRFVVYGS